MTTPSQEGRPEVVAAFEAVLDTHRTGMGYIVDEDPYDDMVNSLEVRCACGQRFKARNDASPDAWDLHASHVAAALAAVVVSSPATPNGQGERAGHQHSWEGSAGAAYDYCLHCRVMRDDAPSPASPAETREGREAALTRIARLHVPGGWEFHDGTQYCAECGDPDDDRGKWPCRTAKALAASPAAVPLPEETESAR